MYGAVWLGFPRPSGRGGNPHLQRSHSYNCRQRCCCAARTWDRVGSAMTQRGSSEQTERVCRPRMHNMRLEQVVEICLHRMGVEATCPLLQQHAHVCSARGEDRTPWHKPADQECRTCEWSRLLKYICAGWEWKPLAHVCKNAHARAQQGGGDHTPWHRHRSKTAGGRIVVCPNDATQWTKHRPSQLSTQATKVARPSKTCRWFSRTYSPLQRCSGQGAARPLHMLPQFPKKWHHVGKTKIQKCSRKVVFAPAAMNASSTSGHRPWHTLQDHRTLNERERERGKHNPPRPSRTASCAAGRG